jgi:hypothetical protein
MPVGVLVLAGLILLGGLTYGGLVVTCGVYGDDPNALYDYQRLGTAGFDVFYGWARPFSTWMHKLVIPLTGINMARINLVTIALRITSCWMLFLLVRELSDGDAASAWMAAAIALVYPGFAQQSQAVQFLLHFSVLSLALFSLWAMIRGVREKNRKLHILWMAAAILGACAHISIEYFIGLELLRPVILAAALKRTDEKKWRAGAFTRIYWPFLLLIMGYLVWRTVLFQPAYPRITLIEGLRDAPLYTALGIGGRIVADLFSVMAGAWAQMVRAIRGLPVTLLMMVSGTAGAGLALGGWVLMERKMLSNSQRGYKQLLVIGGFALLLGGVPLWVSGTPVQVVHPWNRTTLCFLVGVSMLSAGLLALLSRKARGLAFAALVGLALVFQQQIGADYAREWELVRGLFRQLTEQVPQLKEGTLVLYDDLPLRYYSANNLNALLNWTYDPERGVGDEKYKVFEIDERLGGALPALEAGLAIQHNTFCGNTSQVLLIALDAKGDVILLDRNSPYPGLLAGRTREAEHLSVPEAVVIYGMGQAQFPAELDE